MARRVPLEDKLIATTLLVVGLVMAVMTAVLLNVIGSRFPAETDESPLPLLTLGVVIVMVACYAATMVAMWLLVRWMVVQPTRRLLEATRQVADGRLDYRAEPASTDELGELAESFNRMTARLEESFQSIERLSQFNTLILDSMSSGLIAVDSAGRIQMANRTACAITGLDPTELDGAAVTQFESIRPLAEVILKSVEDRRSVGRIEIALNPEGNEETLLGVSVSLIEDDGGAVAVFADLTEYKRLEREARLRREMAALGELTAGVVHEIRSPLGVISATAQLLSRDMPADHPTRAAATTILDEVRQLERTAVSLLMFSRPLELDFKETEFADVIERTVTLCRPRLDEAGVRLEEDIPKRLPRVRTDRERLAQALSNLVHNSIDALDRGGTIRITASTRGTGSVAIRIADDGPGIPPEVHDRLFEPFFTQKEGGTGLGLSIVHKVITAHDGSIELLSAPTGTTFEITLPVVKDESAE